MQRCGLRLKVDPNNSSVHEALFRTVAGSQAGPADDSADVLALGHLETLADMTGLSLDDTSMYCLAWSWSCQTPLAITKDEFMKGMLLVDKFMSRTQVDVDAEKPKVKAVRLEFVPCLCALRRYVHEMDETLHKNPKEFRRFYRFIFKWLQSPETTIRTSVEMGMSIESAVELWRMLFPEYRHFPHLEDWISFCTAKEKFGRDAISRDLWEQFLEFTSLTCYDTYDVNDAWPSAIDDFVDYFKRTKAK